MKFKFPQVHSTQSRNSSHLCKSAPPPSMHCYSHPEVKSLHIRRWLKKRGRKCPTKIKRERERESEKNDIVQDVMKMLKSEMRSES